MQIPLNKIVALNIKYYRFKQNISQKKLCKALNDMDGSYLSAIERGTVNLRCSTIDSIAKGLKVSNDQLCNIETAKIAKTFPDNLTKYKKMFEK